MEGKRRLMDIVDKYGQVKEQVFFFLVFLSQNSDFWTHSISAFHFDAIILQTEMTEMEHRYRPEF